MSEIENSATGVQDPAVIELVMGYLKKMGFSKCLYFLEKESGISIFRSTKEISFLRELILSGNWVDAMQFLEPLRVKVTEFNRLEAAILKCQFYDLVDSIRNSTSSNSAISLADPLSVKLSDTIRRLKSLCESPSEFSLVCSYLMPRIKNLETRPSFMNRMECFDLICMIIQSPSQNPSVLGELSSLFQLPIDTEPAAEYNVTKRNLNEIIHSGLQKELQSIEQLDGGHKVAHVKIRLGVAEFQTRRQVEVDLKQDSRPGAGGISQVKSGKKSVVWDLNFSPAKVKPVKQQEEEKEEKVNPSIARPNQSNATNIMRSYPPVPSSFEAVRIIECDQPLRSCCFSSDGNQLAIGSNARWLRLFSCSSTCSMTCIHQFNNIHKGSVYCIDFASTNQMVATGSNDKTIRLIGLDKEYRDKESDVGDGNIVRGHTGTVRCLQFLPSSSHLTASAGSGDFAVRIADVNQLSMVADMRGHTNSVHGLCCHSESVVISGGEDATIRMWDVRSCQSTSLLSTSSSGSVTSLTKHLIDDYILGSAHVTGQLCLWDVRMNKRLMDPIQPHYSECRNIDLTNNWQCKSSNDALVKLLVTSSFDLTCVVTKYDQSAQNPLEIIGRYKGHNDKVLSAVWSPNMPMFVSTGVDGLAFAWKPTIN